MENITTDIFLEGRTGNEVKKLIAECLELTNDEKLINEEITLSVESEFGSLPRTFLNGPTLLIPPTIYNTPNYAVYLTFKSFERNQPIILTRPEYKFIICSALARLNSEWILYHIYSLITGNIFSFGIGLYFAFHRHFYVLPSMMLFNHLIAFKERKNNYQADRLAVSWTNEPEMIKVLTKFETKKTRFENVCSYVWGLFTGNPMPSIEQRIKAIL